MSTVLDLLKGVTNYPVPARVLNRIALVRDIELTAEVTTEMVSSKDYQLAEADVMRFVSTAPNVTQAGISFDTLVSDRNALRTQANLIYKKYGDELYQPDGEVKTKFGYKGDRL